MYKQYTDNKQIDQIMAEIRSRQKVIEYEHATILSLIEKWQNILDAEAQNREKLKLSHGVEVVAK